MQHACFHFRCEVCVLAFSQSRVVRVADPVEFAAGWDLAVKERIVDDAQIVVHAECSSGSRTVGQVAEVLVVDDNPIDRLRASRLVEQDAQCCSVHAKDGAEALERLADRNIAMVLTDLQMAGMDGLELVRTIRKEYPQIPVILMTAHGARTWPSSRFASGPPTTFPSRGWPRSCTPSWHAHPPTRRPPPPPLSSVPD